MNEELRELLVRDTPKDCVSIRVFLNSEAMSIKYETRTAASLKRSGISMRNVNGEWITDNQAA